METKNKTAYGLRILLAGLLALWYLLLTGDAFTEILFLCLVCFDLAIMRRLQ